MADGEGVKRRTSGGRKSVVDQDSLRETIQSRPLTSKREHAYKLTVPTEDSDKVLVQIYGPEEYL